MINAARRWPRFHRIWPLDPLITSYRGCTFLLGLLILLEKIDLPRVHSSTQCCFSRRFRLFQTSPAIAKPVSQYPVFPALSIGFPLGHLYVLRVGWADPHSKWPSRTRQLLDGDNDGNYYRSFHRTL